MKYKLLFLVIAAAVFIIPKTSHAESVNSFTSQIQINKDASIEVVETIVYNFGSIEHHGIYRDIPYKYKARGGNYTLKINVISVTDQSGQPYIYSTSKKGSNLEIKIGDPSSTVTGVRSYKIDYTVMGAINYFNDHDELYWNTTGNDWLVPIFQATQYVDLPAAVAQTALQTACYFGPVGSTSPCDGLNSNSTQTYFSQINLESGQGLTAVVGFPKGLVHQPTGWEKLLKIISDNWILALPIITLFGMWFWRRRFGSDAAKLKVIVPQYEAPSDLTPTEVGTLLDQSADNQDISAEIIYLAVKGYLKITRLQTKILFFNKTDYQLDLLKMADSSLNDFEKKIIESLFNGLQTVKLSTLKNSFYRDLQDIKKQVYGSLVAKGYLVKNPENIRNLYSAFGAVVLFLGIAIGAHFGAYTALSLAVSGLIIIIFSRFMSYRTVKGVEGLQYILGLKMYLSVAEKDRLKFFNAPEKTPEQFEKLLPYAMVLKVEEQWAKQFEGIYNRPPSWYSDPMGGAFNSFYLVHSLNSFHSSASSTMASRPSSAGGGGSGFGGGGFSGGGFGGGGGGSW